MDRRIRIERPVSTQNDYGEAVPTWELVDLVWAEKVPLKGKELLAAQQIVPQAETMFRIRWRDDIKPNRDENMRIIEDEISYGIQHIAEIGRRDGLAILVQIPE